MEAPACRGRLGQKGKGRSFQKKVYKKFTGDDFEKHYQKYILTAKIGQEGRERGTKERGRLGREKRKGDRSSSIRHQVKVKPLPRKNLKLRREGKDLPP